MSIEGPRVDVPTKLAPFNPTADDAIALVLSLAQLRGGDVLVDLGCGDARVLIAAAESCAELSCSGFEFDGAIAARAVSNLSRARESVAARIAIHHADACGAEATAALERATIVFVYLVPSGLARVKGLLEGVLARGGRVVSNMFSVPGWTPQETRSARGCKVYLYYGGT